MAPWGVSTLAAWPLPISPSVLGPQVEAKKAVPKEEHPGRAQGGSGLPPGRTRKVFVGGLAPSVDEAALRQYFEQFGPVDDAVVMHDHESRRPRGFGFVTFANEETVDDVLNAGPLQVGIVIVCGDVRFEPRIKTGIIQLHSFVLQCTLENTCRASCQQRSLADAPGHLRSYL